MCQAIARLAEVHGHGWIHFSGEDLAAMARTGRPPRKLFRPLTQGTHQGHKYWTAAIHRIFDSTCQFRNAQEKRFGGSAGPPYFMREDLHGLVGNAPGDACGKTLLQ
eukprot:8611305-Pyramimonas_sp.AAC.1